MADNYLEQRMEDLRTGRLKQQSGRLKMAPGTTGKGYIRFPFPQRRVLIIGSLGVIEKEIARSYLRAGCRVAIFDNSTEPGESMAKEEGVRFFNVDWQNESALQNAFEKLLKAWLDVDVVINSVFDICNKQLDALLGLLKLWNAHRKRFAIPNEYGGRIINVWLNKTLIEVQDDVQNEAQTRWKRIMMDQMEAVAEFNPSVNLLCLCGENSDALALQTARTCLFLSLPGNECINATRILLTK